MSTLLDIFGSVVIAGMLFMLIVKLNLFSSQAGYSSDSELKLIQNTKTLAEIIDYDFRKIGYKYDGVAITVADSNHIKFYADMQAPGNSGYGTMDIVEYTIGNTSEVAGTVNPNDKIIKRTITTEGGTLLEAMDGPSLGLVRLKFSYLDSTNLETNLPSKIRYIKTEMWVEGSDPIPDAFTNNSPYSKTYWEFTINPRNL